MFTKRLINALVSILTMILTIAVLVIGVVYLRFQLGYFAETFRPIGPDEMIVMAATLVIGVLVCFVMFIGAVGAGVYIVAILGTGEGLLLRRIEKNEFLLNPDGSVFKRFEETEFIWRWDKMFSGRRLISYT